MKPNYLPEGLRERINAAVDKFNAADIEWFARQAHGRGHYDAYEELGVPLEPLFKRDAITHLTGLIAGGFIDHIPQSSAEFRKVVETEAIPRIKATHTRTVEWIIDNMPQDQLQELVDSGADLSLTEWDYTDGSMVSANFYRAIDDENMELIANVLWNVSDNTHMLTWYI